MRHCYITTGVAKIFLKIDIVKAEEGVKPLGFAYIAGMNVKCNSH